jgi:hypothetical protein
MSGDGSARASLLRAAALEDKPSRGYSGSVTLFANAQQYVSGPAVALPAPQAKNTLADTGLTPARDGEFAAGGWNLFFACSPRNLLCCGHNPTPPAVAKKEPVGKSANDVGHSKMRRGR